jgi:hypothetical protein
MKSSCERVAFCGILAVVLFLASCSQRVSEKCDAEAAMKLLDDTALVESPSAATILKFEAAARGFDVCATQMQGTPAYSPLIGLEGFALMNAATIRAFRKDWTRANAEFEAGLKDLKTSASDPLASPKLRNYPVSVIAGQLPYFRSHDWNGLTKYRLRMKIARRVDSVPATSVPKCRTTSIVQVSAMYRLPHSAHLFNFFGHRATLPKSYPLFDVVELKDGHLYEVSTTSFKVVHNWQSGSAATVCGIQSNIINAGPSYTIESNSYKTVATLVI